MNTASPITALKGVGEKTAALFHRVGVDTVGRAFVLLSEDI